jgi:hypothetical protein
LLACSTSARQPAEPPTAAPDPAPTTTESPAAAPAPATSGSAADPWQGEPADPAADLALLRADVDIICSAAKVTGGKTWIEVGPHIAETMKTMHKIGCSPITARGRWTSSSSAFVA